MLLWTLFSIQMIRMPFILLEGRKKPFQGHSVACVRCVRPCYAWPEAALSSLAALWAFERCLSKSGYLRLARGRGGGQACLSLLQIHSSNSEDGGWCLKELHSLRTGKQWTLTRAKQASVRGVTVTPMLVFRGEVIRLPSTRSQCSSVGAHTCFCVRVCVNALTLTFCPVIAGIITASRCSHITICWL